MVDLHDSHVFHVISEDNFVSVLHQFRSMIKKGMVVQYNLVLFENYFFD